MKLCFLITALCLHAGFIQARTRNFISINGKIYIDSKEKTETKEEKGSVQAHTYVDVINDEISGDIRIEGNKDSDTIDFKARITTPKNKLDCFTLETVEQNDERRVLKVVRNKNKACKNIHAYIELVVKLPQATHVNIKNSNGKIIGNHIETLHVNNNNGTITCDTIGKKAHLTTTNGKIVGKNMPELWAYTTNGSIDCQHISTEAHLNTSRGSIKATDIPKIWAHTSNGSITCDEIKHYAELKTSNGKVWTRMTGIVEKLLINSSNGKVEVFLPKEYAHKVYIKTSNAKTHCYDFLRAQNQNQADVQIKTSNESVTVKAN